MTTPSNLSFGAELRRERLVREISLEEISADTKISVRLLKALEDSDFARLPAPIFTRGFIRAYSRHIGIDPEEKVCAYLADLAAASPAGSPGARPSPGGKPSPRPRWARGKGVTAGAIVGGVTTVLLLLGLIARPERRAPQLSERRAAPRVASVAFKNVSVSNETTPAIRQDARDAPAAPAAAAEVPVVTVVLEFDQDSWTRLEAAGNTLFAGLVRRGEVKRFESRGGLRLTVGNAGGVRVTVDGHALDPLGRQGQVVRDVPLNAVPTRG